MSLAPQGPPEADSPLVYHGPDFTDFDIALGISRKVTLRTIAPAGRVPDHYFQAWPLRTVLRRWRRRSATDSDTTFHGARLFPSLWNVLYAMRERESGLQMLDAPSLGARQAEALRCDARTDGCTTAMDGQSLHALVGYLSRRETFERLMSQGWPLPMVPELLLYKRTSGHVHGVRFVNVLQHDEGLWSEVVDDLRRLRAAGVRAGVWRFGKAPKGSPASLRAARRRLMPTRQERRVRQIRGVFPWGDVEACRGLAPPPDIALAGPPVAEEGCLGCGRPAAELEWLYFSSPSWTWARLCGRAGWLAICPDCEHQVDFRLTSMN